MNLTCPGALCVCVSFTLSNLLHGEEVGQWKSNPSSVCHFGMLSVQSLCQSWFSNDIKPAVAQRAATETVLVFFQFCSNCMTAWFYLAPLN